MVIIDGSFLLGVAAVLSSLGTLWRISRHYSEKICPRCAKRFKQDGAEGRGCERGARIGWPAV
ncbi:MAG: hypothetical protein ACK4S3_08720 [Parvibaculum sp.]